VHEAALLGGRQSIRGYEWNRFAGDALLYGNSEIRIPLARVRLVTRGTLGVIGLADAGRVWVDGDSPGGWHTASGGGLSFASMGQAVSVLYARGERGRVYAHWGFPF
jgi:outer membrane translocation and assembly module TamA